MAIEVEVQEAMEEVEKVMLRVVREQPVAEVGLAGVKFW